jgi:hypothetical protein
MLNNPILHADPLGNSSIKPNNSVMGSNVKLGKPTFNTTDATYRTQLKLVTEHKQEN